VGVKIFSSRGFSKVPSNARACAQACELPDGQVESIWSPEGGVSDGEFARRLGEVREKKVDQETTARILAAEAEGGELVSHQCEIERMSAWTPNATRNGWSGAGRARAGRHPVGGAGWGAILEVGDGP